MANVKWFSQMSTYSANFRWPIRPNILNKTCSYCLDRLECKCTFLRRCREQILAFCFVGDFCVLLLLIRHFTAIFFFVQADTTKFFCLCNVGENKDQPIRISSDHLDLSDVHSEMCARYDKFNKVNKIIQQRYYLLRNEIYTNISVRSSIFMHGWMDIGLSESFEN